MAAKKQETADSKLAAPAISETSEVIELPNSCNSSTILKVHPGGCTLNISHGVYLSIWKQFKPGSTRAAVEELMAAVRIMKMELEKISKELDKSEVDPTPKK